MKHFEYQLLDVPVDKSFWGGKIDVQALTDKLNELGREGWELVSTVDTELYGGGSRGLLVMLKREL